MPEALHSSDLVMREHNLMKMFGRPEVYPHHEGNQWWRPLKKIKLSFLFCLITVAMLQGCSVPGPNFTDMSQSYQTWLESYNGNSLLLNVVRASKHRPVSFLAIPSITGSGSLTEAGNIGASVLSNVPSSLLGLFTPGIGTNYGLSLQPSLSKSFTFTQSAMDNAEFQKAMLLPIRLETIDYFNRGHLSRELLYSLTLSSIEIEGSTSLAGFYDNYPDSKTYPAFQALLRHLVDLGLGTEIVLTKSKVGPLMPENVPYKDILQYVDVKEKYRLQLEEIQTKGGVARYQLMQTEPIARLCFSDESRATEVMSDFGHEMLCSALSRKVQAPKGAKPRITTITFNTRSTRNLFDYLGSIVRKQLANPDSPPSIRGLPEEIEQHGDRKHESLIFVVKKNTPQIKPVASIRYEDDLYSIPAENNGYTAYVVDLMSQLMSLSRVPGAIPPSPAIVIR